MIYLSSYGLSNEDVVKEDNGMDWMDFNHDGEVDTFEKIVGFEMMNETDDTEYNEEEEMRDELELAGLDYDDLEWMDEDERREALEEAGLDPDDFNF